MTTDWKPIAEKMKYQDGKGVLEDLYGKQELSSNLVADKIKALEGEYITGVTVIRYARRWGIKIRPKGGVNNVSDDREKLLALKGGTKDMTAKELAKACGMSLNWAYNLIRKMGIEFKRKSRIKKKED